MEGLLLHGADNHRHGGNNCDQQLVRFQTVDDRIAGKDTRNVSEKIILLNQLIRLTETDEREHVCFKAVECPEMMLCQRDKLLCCLPWVSSHTEHTSSNKQ